jgi:hypothetical protein
MNVVFHIQIRCAVTRLCMYAIVHLAAAQVQMISLAPGVLCGASDFRQIGRRPCNVLACFNGSVAALCHNWPSEKHEDQLCVVWRV